MWVLSSKSASHPSDFAQGLLKLVSLRQKFLLCKKFEKVRHMKKFLLYVFDLGGDHYKCIQLWKLIPQMKWFFVYLYQQSLSINPRDAVRFAIMTVSFVFFQLLAAFGI